MQRCALPVPGGLFSAAGLSHFRADIHEQVGDHVRQATSKFFQIRPRNDQAPVRDGEMNLRVAAPVEELRGPWAQQERDLLRVHAAIEHRLDDVLFRLVIGQESEGEGTREDSSEP